jgi:hypothetical protein
MKSVILSHLSNPLNTIMERDVVAGVGNHTVIGTTVEDAD